MKIRIIATGMLATLFLLPTASLGETFRVRAVDDDRFRPATRTINKGDRVVWKNTDNSAHTVTARGDNWNMNVTLQGGDTTSRKFRKRGTFKYICDFHADEMRGKIVVQ